MCDMIEMSEPNELRLMVSSDLETVNSPPLRSSPHPHLLIGSLERSPPFGSLRLEEEKKKRDASVVGV